SCAFSLNVYAFEKTRMMISISLTNEARPGSIVSASLPRFRCNAPVATGAPVRFAWVVAVTAAVGEAAAAVVAVGAAGAEVAVAAAAVVGVGAAVAAVAAGAWVGAAAAGVGAAVGAAGGLEHAARKDIKPTLTHAEAALSIWRRRKRMRRM